MNAKKKHIRHRRGLVLNLIPFADSEVGEVSFNDIEIGIIDMSRNEIIYHLNTLIKKKRIGIKENGMYFKKDIVIVRETGDAENDIEGGYNYLFDVELCDVGEENGKLEWRRMSFPHVPYAFGHLSSPEEEKTHVPLPTFHETHIRDHRTIGEDVISLLRERGVNVIVLPELPRRW